MSSSDVDDEEFLRLIDSVDASQQVGADSVADPDNGSKHFASALKRHDVVRSGHPQSSVGNRRAANISVLVRDGMMHRRSGSDSLPLRSPVGSESQLTRCPSGATQEDDTQELKSQVRMKEGEILIVRNKLKKAEQQIETLNAMLRETKQSVEAKAGDQMAAIRSESENLRHQYIFQKRELETVRKEKEDLLAKLAARASNPGDAASVADTTNNAPRLKRTESRETSTQTSLVRSATAPAADTLSSHNPSYTSSHTPLTSTSLPPHPRPGATSTPPSTSPSKKSSRPASENARPSKRLRSGPKESSLLNSTPASSSASPLRQSQSEPPPAEPPGRRFWGVDIPSAARVRSSLPLMIRDSILSSTVSMTTLRKNLAAVLARMPAEARGTVRISSAGSGGLPPYSLADTGAWSEARAYVQGLFCSESPLRALPDVQTLLFRATRLDEMTLATELLAVLLRCSLKCRRQILCCCSSVGKCAALESSCSSHRSESTPDVDVVKDWKLQESLLFGSSRAERDTSGALVSLMNALGQGDDGEWAYECYWVRHPPEQPQGDRLRTHWKECCVCMHENAQSSLSKQPDLVPEPSDDDDDDDSVKIVDPDPEENRSRKHPKGDDVRNTVSEGKLSRGPPEHQLQARADTIRSLLRCMSPAISTLAYDGIPSGPSSHSLVRPSVRPTHQKTLDLSCPESAAFRSTVAAMSCLSYLASDCHSAVAHVLSPVARSPLLLMCLAPVSPVGLQVSALRLVQSLVQHRSILPLMSLPPEVDSQSRQLLGANQATGARELPLTPWWRTWLLRERPVADVAFHLLSSEDAAVQAAALKVASEAIFSHATFATQCLFGLSVPDFKSENQGQSSSASKISGSKRRTPAAPAASSPSVPCRRDRAEGRKSFMTLLSGIVNIAQRAVDHLKAQSRSQRARPGTPSANAHHAVHRNPSRHVDLSRTISRSSSTSGYSRAVPLSTSSHAHVRASSLPSSLPTVTSQGGQFRPTEVLLEAMDTIYQLMRLTGADMFIRHLSARFVLLSVTTAIVRKDVPTCDRTVTTAERLRDIVFPPADLDQGDDAAPPAK